MYPSPIPMHPNHQRKSEPTFDVEIRSWSLFGVEMASNKGFATFRVSNGRRVKRY